MIKKIAIRLPNLTLQKAKAAVKQGKAPTVSNYIASLIDDKSAAESFEDWLADLVRKERRHRN